MRRFLVVDRMVGLLFIVLGAIAVRESLRLAPMRMREVVGDDTFPMLLGLGLILMGVLLAFVVKPQQLPVHWPQGKPARAMLQSAVVIVAYWLLISLLGYTISTFLVASGLFYTMGRYRWYSCLAAGLLFTVVFYIIFVRWLGTPFPSGPFAF